MKTSEEKQNDTLNLLAYVILYIWQLPQNILGVLISLFSYIFGTKGKKKMVKLENNTNLTYGASFNSGVSLGDYIILDQIYSSFSEKKLTQVIQHELGHQKQSTYLGPLYLIIIGIPSLIGNIIFRFKKFKSSTAKNRAYYNQPWEKWADKLTNIDRTVKL